VLGVGVVSEGCVDGWMDGSLVRTQEFGWFLGAVWMCESLFVVAADFLFLLLWLELNYGNMRMDDRHKNGHYLFFLFVLIYIV